MVRNGSLTDAKAAGRAAKSGLDAELIAAYIAEGHQVAATSDNPDQTRCWTCTRRGSFPPTTRTACCGVELRAG